MVVAAATSVLLSIVGTPVAVLAAAQSHDARDAAIIAGVFTLANTILNVITLTLVNRSRRVAEDVASIVDRREGQELPPPDRRFKRKDDPPAAVRSAQRRKRKRRGQQR